MSDIPSHPAKKSLVSRALQIQAEVQSFNSRWTPLSPRGPALSLTWEQLERQLVDLAPSDLQAELVHKLIERTRQFAELKPPEMVLREVLCVAALVLEDSSLHAEEF